jgi:hypothetical protein
MTDLFAHLKLEDPILSKFTIDNSTFCLKEQLSIMNKSFGRGKGRFFAKCIILAKDNRLVIQAGGVEHYLNIKVDGDVRIELYFEDFMQVIRAKRIELECFVYEKHMRMGTRTLSCDARQIQPEDLLEGSLGVLNFDQAHNVEYFSWMQNSIYKSLKTDKHFHLNEIEKDIENVRQLLRKYKISESDIRKLIYDGLIKV